MLRFVLHVWAGPVGGLGLGLLLLGQSAPVLAQLRLIPEASQQVYALMPDLPLENDYIYVRDNIGRPEENTLIQRMMLYHQQIKGRTPTNRLDWQLTLADYLDANEPMYAQAYPGASTLTQNPYNPDRALVQSFTREQRRQLLESILLAYGGDPTPPTLYIPADLEAAVTPVEPNIPPPKNQIVIPTPSSADLLK